MRSSSARPAAVAAITVLLASGLTVAHAQSPGGPPGVDPKKSPQTQKPPPQRPPQAVIKNVAPKQAPPPQAKAPVPKKIVTPASPPLKSAVPANLPKTTKPATPPSTIVNPGSGGGTTKTPLTKIDPSKTVPAGKPDALKSATPIGKTIVPPGNQPLPLIKTAPPVVTKLPLPGSGSSPGTPPVKLPPPGAKLPQVPGQIGLPPPGLKVPNPGNPGPIGLPPPGLKVPKMPPLAKVPPGLYFPPPKLPPAPPPKWVGPPPPIPPSFGWHPWKGKNLLPAFFVGAVIGVGVASAGYTYWAPPPPSCYLAGGVVYYYPGTKICFDFATAVPGDPFVFENRVYYWEPRRYRTVERLIEVERERAEVVDGWADREPTRVTLVKAGMDRAANRAKSVAAVPIDKLDCSTCLTAIGPTEGENGQCTVSLANNCDHAVSVSGGLSLAAAKADDPPLCDFQGEVPTAAEVAACTRPCADFTEAQVFLNAVIPVAGTTRPSSACRVPEPREARAP